MNALRTHITRGAQTTVESVSPPYGGGSSLLLTHNE